MNLYISTYTLAALFIFMGIIFAFFPEKYKSAVYAFPRSKNAAYILFGGSAVYFVYLLSQLGEADFGNIKEMLIVVFGGAAVLAFKYLPDFLSVRGLAVALLLLSRHFLDSAFMQEPTSRLTLVSLTYAIILASLYFGALPYRMRDLIHWLYAKSHRPKTFGALMLMAGLSLVISSLYY